MENTRDDILMHYGMPRRSGRYPWGSGENPYQHTDDFLSRVDELRKQNFKFTDPETGKTYVGDIAIAKSMGMNSTEFRARYSVANNERKQLMVDKIKSLQADGLNNTEIARKLGLAGESSVRSLLKESSEGRRTQAQRTADELKKMIDEHGMVDVGKGQAYKLGVSDTRLTEALYILEAQGYPVYGAGIPQVTNPGKQTNMKVVCAPGTEHKEIYQFDKIYNPSVDFVSHDGGETFDPKFVYPKSLDSKRLQIRYAEDGGVDKDGVIELRRGVDDLDLGGSLYSQVRIMVDDSHYLKGMAVYGDNMPPGVDVIFNTNKSKGTPMLGPKDNSVLKPIKKDPSNPFGALIKEGVNDPDIPEPQMGGQSYYYDKNGKKQLSLINKTRDEGDWSQWSKKLPSQFLSKQPIKLVKQQLGLEAANKQDELNDILALNNPTIKKKLLKSFSDDCDAAAIHLQAASLPRQKYQVILPLKNISDNEVYAPGFDNGEKVALVRFPHGGTFEIPILKVNNRNKEGIDILGKTPKDAIGINKNVADRLSGADFDGDTVMVIPLKNNDIRSTPKLKALEGFDPKLEYKGVPGKFKPMKDTQKQMGVVSNLITDMTIKGASQDEIAKAVRHSMVVIDAEKHGLDWKKSEKDNDISLLKKKWQGHYDEEGKYHEGASTLISMAKSQKTVPKRRGSAIINKETGELEWKNANDKDLYYVDKNGKTKMRTQKSTKMAETNDARTLISEVNSKVENAYADYANKMKALANTARKEMISAGNLKYDASAAKTYKKEVDHLDAQLNEAEKNRPLERQAQLIANSVVATKRKDDPNATKEQEKKWGQQALVEARAKVGAKRVTIDISPREWEAIQSGAISENKLSKILDHADTDKLKEMATPRGYKETITPAKQARIKAMKTSGYTSSEIAKQMGVSTSTISKYL